MRNRLKVLDGTFKDPSQEESTQWWENTTHKKQYKQNRRVKGPIPLDQNTLKKNTFEQGKEGSIFTIVDLFVVLTSNRFIQSTNI